MTRAVDQRSHARAVLFALAAIASLVGGCTKNATTGRSQWSLGAPSRDQEIALGETEGPKLTQEFGGEVSNPALRGYITEVGMKLKDQTEVDGPKRQWIFTLLDSDVINAFALPGERVFITRAIADKMTSEAELAGVLGHEIGHVMARHTAERMSQSTVIGGIVAVGGAVAGATIKDSAIAGAVPTIAGAGGQLTILSFSREQESEADSLGMRYMTKAMYNPKGQLEVMQILQRESGSGGLEMLQTHPLPKTRIDRVQQLLAKDYAYTQSGPDASKYQFYPERFQQRYLAIRATEPAKPKTEKKKAAGEIDFAKPATWCAMCASHEAPHGGDHTD